MTNGDTIHPVFEVIHASPSPPSLRLIPFLFFLLGIGLLVPWNAFISAKPYFSARACEYDNLELWFGLVYTSSSALSLGVLILHNYLKDVCGKKSITDDDDDVDDWEEEVPDDDSPPFWSVILPLFVYTLVFVVMAVLVFFPKVPYFAAITLVGLAACGIMVGMASAGIVTVANLFDASTAIGPHFQGQAMGGVAVSTANFFVEWGNGAGNFSKQHCSNTNHDDEDEDNNNNNNRGGARIMVQAHNCQAYDKPDWGTFVYFLTGALLLITCIAGFIYIHRVQVRRARYEPVNLTEGDDENVGLEIDDDDDDGDEQPVLEMEDDQEDGGEVVPKETTTAYVWRCVRGPWLAVYLNFVVTLSMFPSWTSTIQSVHQCSSSWRIVNDMFIPMTFVLFNSSDLSGRLLASLIPTTISSIHLVGFAVLRIVFFGLLYFCNVDGSTRYTVSSDAYSLMVLIFFGMSNGLLLAVSFMHVPSLLPSTVEMQKRGSEFLNFAINFGLLSGSLSSFVYTAVASS